MTSKAPANKDSAGGDKNKEEEKTATSLMEAIEEDDEFEEFEPAHWAANEEEAEDAQQWQDNWDDDMDDDFTQKLRAELAKNADGA
jgi:hypothetical protein